MTENCIFLQKYLVMSKKSSTFARFFVGSVLHAFSSEVYGRTPEKGSVRAQRECTRSASIAQLVEH